MNKQRVKTLTNSVTFKLVVSIMLIILPIIILLIYINNQSHNTLMEQVEKTHKEMLQSYLFQVDGQMESASSFSMNLVLNENDPLIAVTSQDEADVQYAKMRLKSNMDQNALSRGLLDGLFVLLKTHEGDSFIVTAGSGSSQADRERIQQYVSDYVVSMNREVLSEDMKWHVVTLDNIPYMIQIVAGRNSIISGSYINLSKLSPRLGVNDDPKLFFTISQELNALLAKQKADIQAITVSSKQGSFLIVELLNERVILNSLPFMQRYTLLITIFLLLTIPLLFLIVRIIVFRPLNRLVGAMRIVEGGDLNYRVKSNKGSSEFKYVNDSFNQMVSEVKNLKIDVHEEMLRTQRAQLRNLQLQIRPHFLINSLNMVYNAVENRHYDLASKLILHSVDYFRYMVKVDDDFVPLNEEISHVKTYLAIQQIRYGELFTYSIETDQLLEGMLVPPLIVQTFIENSIKYAMRMTEPMQIDICINAFEVDYVPYARFTIQDTGNGFPVSMLKNLGSNNIIDADGNHVGIRNVTRRLELLFKGQAGWHFYNDDGAVVELTLPVMFEIPQEQNKPME